MSTPARLAKGTGFTLGRVAIAIVGQIATVPIYLSYWNAQTYGVWLILQGMFGYLSLFSTAYHQYAYGEVLKRGPEAPDAVHTLYWSSLWIASMIAAVEFCLILGFAPMAVSTAVNSAVPSGAAGTAETLVLIVILHGVLNLLTMPFGAITSQTMTIHGYYPALAGWGLLRTATSLIAPAAAVALGADLLIAGLVLIAAHAVPALLSLPYYVRLARHYGLLARPRVDWRAGFVGALYCLPLAARTFIDSFRQQGFRLLLGAYAGPTAVTALATTRTFANVLHQGLGTITAPLLPELMRYIVNRDQKRTEGAFAIVWLCLFVLLVPGVLVLCLLAEPVFLFWTRGAVEFDPVLFLMLLVVVLAFAAGQPLTAVLQGKNRVSWLVLAAVTAVVGLGLFVLLLVPPFALRGSGLALLGAEFCAVAVNATGAARTLRASGLAFPMQSFAIVAANVILVLLLTLLAVTVFANQPLAFALPFAANTLLGLFYWATIPGLARKRIRSELFALRVRLLGRFGASAPPLD